MHKWEYKVVDTMDEAVMNKLGEQGWELISVPCSGGDYYGGCSMVFKRPKQ
jgi:hypothetical protein